ncbi:unnamed protein product [Cylindrotheca closterium]|uniref:Matrin-type domain-containing protein n=1 Tax=Cylindrotheca closterium TaxID=2856 RepID=A0AAD2CGC6_9STRA|nr:unnamed protein product [Cylindrotheca closterium]
MTSNQKKREPWRSETRYCCAACNVWMDNNRASIMTHENGRKHKEAVSKGLEQKRQDRMKEERDLQFLQSSLQKMERAALQSHLQHDTALLVNDLSVARPPNDEKQSSQFRAPPPATKGKKEWNSRKRQRSEGKQDDGNVEAEQVVPQRRKITGNEGSYKLDDKTYLEGPTYSEILEEDMPIEIWTGPIASLEEKRLIDRQAHWKKGIITTIRKNAQKMKIHIAYLSSLESNEETTELNVSVNRIRLLLGSDEKIPETLEEARLLAMGGEEINVEQQQSKEIVEETGFSSWSTVAIKRSTVRHEHKEERNRLREDRKRAALEKEAQEKEAEMRQMEAAKVANADDSALGAFDALGTGDYRGFQIHQEAEVTLADTAKRLANGSVAFKKKKKKPSKRSIRQTSAD